MSHPLLIIDDFGMEHGTEYRLEQAFNVIDSRYCSRKPLIVTTNLALDSLQHLQDTAHARIHDRLLEMCASIRFTGENFRQETHAGEHDRRKNVLIKYSLTLLFVSSESITNHNTKQYDYCVVFWRS